MTNQDILKDLEINLWRQLEIAHQKRYDSSSIIQALLNLRSLLAQIEQ